MFVCFFSETNVFTGFSGSYTHGFMYVFCMFLYVFYGKLNVNNAKVSPNMGLCHEKLIYFLN